MAIRFSEEFKADAVRMALSGGVSRRQLATDLGVGFSTLSAWVRKSRKAHKQAISPSNVDMADAAALARENDRLRKELALVREEREILKKATQFFAEISK